MEIRLTVAELAVLADCVTQARENTEEVNDEPKYAEFYHVACALEERLNEMFIRAVCR